MRKEQLILALALCVLAWMALPFGLSAQSDTCLQRKPDTLVVLQVKDTLAAPRWTLRTNLAWAAAAEPNLGFEFRLGKHWTLGANAGLKPWPRWWAWDWDMEKPVRWRNFTIVPELRFYFSQAFEKWFIGADLLYTHFNVGGVTFPFGLYPEVRDHRVQGDLLGIGLFGGRSWRLADHWRLELEAGAALGYRWAGKYECAHCGAQVGESIGPAVVPKVGVNITYDFRKRTQEVVEMIQIQETNNQSNQ